MALLKLRLFFYFAIFTVHGFEVHANPRCDCSEFVGKCSGSVSSVINTEISNIYRTEDEPITYRQQLVVVSSTSQCSIIEVAAKKPYDETSMLRWNGLVTVVDGKDVGMSSAISFKDKGFATDYEVLTCDVCKDSNFSKDEEKGFFDDIVDELDLEANNLSTEDLHNYENSSPVDNSLYGQVSYEERNKVREQMRRDKQQVSQTARQTIMVTNQALTAMRQGQQNSTSSSYQICPEGYQLVRSETSVSKCYASTGSRDYVPPIAPSSASRRANSNSQYKSCGPAIDGPGC